MITVLLSTYNGEKYLSEQLESLLNQSFSDFLILIRDDCSKDETMRLVNEYKKNYPEKIKILNNKNENLQSTNSFLELLKHADSELYCFCDQDDFWEKDKLRLLFEFYKNNCDENKPTLVHTYADVVDERLKLLEKQTLMFNRNKYGMERNFVWQVFQNDVTGCTMMINNKMKKLICNLNFKNENIIQHDWFFAQIAHLYNSKFLIPCSTIKYRQHHNNVIGYKKTSILKRISAKFRKRPSYPYYDQITAVLKVCDSIDPKLIQILTEFSGLKKQSKYKRIVWHVKNRFLRDENIFYKLYQLFIC